MLALGSPRMFLNALRQLAEHYDDDRGGSAKRYLVQFADVFEASMVDRIEWPGFVDMRASTIVALSESLHGLLSMLADKITPQPYLVDPRNINRQVDALSVVQLWGFWRENYVPYDGWGLELRKKRL